MARIGNFFIIPPDQWLFASHGDVLAAKTRAAEWFAAYQTYEGAEHEITAG